MNNSNYKMYMLLVTVLFGLVSENLLSQPENSYMGLCTVFKVDKNNNVTIFSPHQSDTIEVDKKVIEAEKQLLENNKVYRGICIRSSSTYRSASKEFLNLNNKKKMCCTSAVITLITITSSLLYFGFDFKFFSIGTVVPIGMFGLGYYFQKKETEKNNDLNLLMNDILSERSLALGMLCEKMKEEMLCNKMKEE